MICPKCGKELKSKLCNNCRFDVEKDSIFVPFMLNEKILKEYESDIQSLTSNANINSNGNTGSNFNCGEKEDSKRKELDKESKESQKIVKTYNHLGFPREILGFILLFIFISLLVIFTAFDLRKNLQKNKTSGNIIPENSSTSEIVPEDSSTSEIVSEMSSEIIIMSPQERLNENLKNGSYQQIIPENEILYCLKNEGSVDVFTKDSFEENFEGWKNIKKIISAKKGLIGLSSDGMVLTSEDCRNGSDYIFETTNWENVIDICYEENLLVGLCSDGEVLCSPMISDNENKALPNETQKIKKMNDCKKILTFNSSHWDKEKNTKYLEDGSIEYSYQFFYLVREWIGITNEGRIITDSVKPEESFAKKIEKYSDIQDLVICVGATFALSKEGKVICLGDVPWNTDASSLMYDLDEVKSWTNITEIAGGNYHLVALNEDGTVSAVGDNSHGRMEVDEWKDVVHIEANDYATIGYLKSGEILITSYNIFEN